MYRFLMQSAWVERVGWVLVHSLWQFALVALAAFVVQARCRGARQPCATRFCSPP